MKNKTILVASIAFNLILVAILIMGFKSPAALPTTTPTQICSGDGFKIYKFRDEGTVLYVAKGDIQNIPISLIGR